LQFFFAFKAASILAFNISADSQRSKIFGMHGLGLIFAAAFEGKQSSLQDNGCETDVNKNHQKNLWRKIVIVSLPSVQKKREFLKKTRMA
jgi:hypothetical protein